MRLGCSETLAFASLAQTQWRSVENKTQNATGSEPLFLLNSKQNVSLLTVHRYRVMDRSCRGCGRKLEYCFFVRSGEGKDGYFFGGPLEYRTALEAAFGGREGLEVCWSGVVGVI